MKKLKPEEKIAIIEQAPVEAQLMIAKAFIRKDIKDEDIQYTFNNATLEELAGDSEIENIDVDEEPEGIGAITGNFTIRTTRPQAGNKNYIRKSDGGWSPCIKGNPTYKPCNVLANCVGYANGRFNEIYNEIKKYSGCKYPMSTNAENFIEVAKKLGLKTGSTPKPGAIICWQKGTLSSKDGAGHVEVVERINDNGSIYTSSSGWGSSAIYWNSTRKNTDKNWGMKSTGYTFRAFIYNPAVTEDPVVYTKGIYKCKYNMYIRKSPNGEIVKVKDCTDAMKSALTSKKPNDNAIIKKGTQFTALDITKSGKEYWAKNYSGYICINDGKVEYCSKTK